MSELTADAIASSAPRWVAACGGMRPRRGRNLKGRCLSFVEREEIALARARGETMRAIARRLGRSPSTISRKLSPALAITMRSRDGQHCSAARTIAGVHRCFARRQE